MGRLVPMLAFLGACNWVLPLERGTPRDLLPPPDRAGDRAVADARLDLPLSDHRVDNLPPVDMTPIDLTPIPGTWVTIKAGTFTMGSPGTEACRDKYLYSTEETAHEVKLTRDFEISATEVTQAQFDDVMGYNPTTWGACANCPIDNVTWHLAAAYCNRLSGLRGLAQCYVCTVTVDAGATSCTESPAYAGQKIYDCPGYRLPTEAEWERAYRAGTQTALYTGALAGCDVDTAAGQIGWYQGNATKPRPVGLLTPNAWGLFDMAGNLWEWCHDRGKADLGAQPATDPVIGAATGTPNHVLRGGSWHSPAYKLRAAYREFMSPTNGGGSDGFRCVRGLPPP